MRGILYRSDIAWGLTVAVVAAGLCVGIQWAAVHAMAPVKAKVVEPATTVVRKVTPGPIADAQLGPLWLSHFVPNLREPPPFVEPLPKPAGKEIAERWASNFNTQQVWGRVCRTVLVKKWRGRKYRLIRTFVCLRQLKLEQEAPHE